MASLDEEVMALVRKRCEKMTPCQYRDEIECLIDQLQMEASGMPDDGEDEDDE